MWHALAQLVLSIIGSVSVRPLTCMRCECASETDPVKARETADAVIEGRALDNTGSGRVARDTTGLTWFEIRFVVMRVWKGPARDTIVVRTGDPGRGGCGYSFAAGEPYILFLYRYHSALTTSSCSLTQQSSLAGSLIKALGPPLR